MWWRWTLTRYQQIQLLFQGQEQALNAPVLPGFAALNEAVFDIESAHALCELLAVTGWCVVGADPLGLALNDHGYVQRVQQDHRCLAHRAGQMSSLAANVRLLLVLLLKPLVLSRQLRE